MNLIAAQAELQEKSKEARKKRNKRNAQSPRKVKQPPRARVSEKTLLILLAQDPTATGPVRLAAVKLLLQLGGKLPVEIIKNDEPEPQTAPAVAPRGSDLAPARPV